MDFTKKKARDAKILEAINKQQNPRVKSIKLAGSRLATRIARQANSSKSAKELLKLSTAQSTITIAMTVVEDDPQRASRLLDMARSLANANVNKELPDGK
jgi:ribosomal protein S16